MICILLYKNIAFYDKIQQKSSNFSVYPILRLSYFSSKIPKYGVGLILGWRSYFHLIFPKYGGGSYTGTRGGLIQGSLQYIYIQGCRKKTQNP